MEAKVLIVEVEPIVAFEIESILREAGFEIVGCVGSLNKALAMLKNTDCDIAVSRWQAILVRVRLRTRIFAGSLS
jgi:DNA-binding NarL/FixJ family response regulator